RPASFIEQALSNLRVAMILGCVLVALIVVAFLFEWRTAVISLTAIPLSIVTGVVVLRWLGALGWGGRTLNTMVVAGVCPPGRAGAGRWGSRLSGGGNPAAGWCGRAWGGPRPPPSPSPPARRGPRPPRRRVRHS